MSELSAIQKTRWPHTIDSLDYDLQQLGLATGDVVLVHASLSSIGWVCGEQQAVIAALLQAIGAGGTLVMPAHTSANSDPALWENPPVPTDWIDTIRSTMPAFSPDITPTRGMGKIAECFRTYPGTLRSDHPQVSFCANGKLAEQITRQHSLSPFFGKDTPLGALYTRNAKILLLGVGYDRCTAFHLAEYLSDRPQLCRHGCAMNENGSRLWKWFEDYDYDADDFPNIGAAFEADGNVNHGKIGNADCRLFHLQPAVDFAHQWLLNNRPAK